MPPRRLSLRQPDSLRSGRRLDLRQKPLRRPGATPRPPGLKRSPAPERRHRPPRLWPGTGNAVASPSITLNIYSHMFTNTDTRAAEIMEATFANVRGTD
jgi:hypothetical protein